MFALSILLLPSPYYIHKLRSSAARDYRAPENNPTFMNSQIKPWLLYPMNWEGKVKIFLDNPNSTSMQHGCLILSPKDPIPSARHTWCRNELGLYGKEDFYMISASFTAETGRCDMNEVRRLQENKEWSHDEGSWMLTTQTWWRTLRTPKLFYIYPDHAVGLSLPVPLSIWCLLKTTFAELLTNSLLLIFSMPDLNTWGLNCRSAEHTELQSYWELYSGHGKCHTTCYSKKKKKV